ncbi:Maf family protein [Lentisalinibacter salinarum]|uniref:Maf family protein n=1 Tax=Lentisalinibacter salinarum TaxID=2992239 RepID=UPI0038642DA5
MENPAPNAVVLASSSPYRRDLLARILGRFECVAPDLDETPLDDEAPAALSLRLAREKAAAAASRHAGATVIGSDQVAVLEGRACGKPGSRDAAVAQLLAARGLPMRFLTSVCVIHGSGGEERVHTDVTEVRFRHFERALAERYVDRDRSWDCAGGFKAEGSGPVLFERIESQDPTGLVGLPLIWLARTLEDLGVPLL